MRLKLMRLIVTIGCFVFLSGTLTAQNCIPTNINGAVINLVCNQACSTLVFQIPHLKSTSDYTLVSVLYSPYPYVTATGTEDPIIYNDDQYGALFNLPFTFCFYGSLYTSAVVGSNGIMTFDPANASCANAWPITTTIPYAGGSPCNAGTTYYPRASIMGAYSDLDPRTIASPGDRKIQWEVIGTAPCRKFVVSYYHIGVYGNTCGFITPNTFQMVMHESTGIVEVFIEQKACLSTTNGGAAILGIQNWFQNLAIAAPGKNNTVWSENNTGYRFIPSSGASRYVISELYTLTGTLITTADTITTTPGLLDLRFLNVCPPAGNNTYVVKTTFSACENPASLLISYDTITINRINVTVLANVTSSDPSCSGATNGTITVSPTNGTGPYTFSLDGGAPQPGPVPFTFNNVPPGNHNVLITDANGCVSNIISVVIGPGPVLTTTVTTTDVLCNGGSTGIITVTQPTIGNPPYEYSLDGVTWQASNIFNGLAAGIYTVYYREGNGCQGSQPVTINEPAAMTATTSNTPAVCNGQSNGIINVSSAGGVTPYQYSIDGGINWQASNIFNVAAGNYTVTIRDGNNCTITRPVTVTQPAVLTANSVNSNATCDGGSDGIINVTANGGNTSYQYSIDGVNFQASNIFNVAPGNYTVTVKDNLGCTATFNTTVGLTSNLLVTAQTDRTICEGSSVQLQLNSNATVYAWAPATGLSSTSIANPVASPTVTTQYIVTATLARCSANDTVIVNVNAAPIPDAGADGFICYGQTYQLQASGGTQYSWTPSTYLSNASVPNPVVSPSRTITYTLSVNDANGCPSLVTDIVTVDVTPPIKVSTFPYDTIGYPGDQFQLLATSTANIYTWTPAIGLTDPTIPDPVVTVGAIGIDVLYQVIASTAAGCKGEGYVRVKVYKGPDIYVATGFTPNNDGMNDKFIPFPVGIKKLNYFKVFNRWGQMVYSTTVLNEGWDGRFGGKEQASGVYVWMLQGITKDDKIITKQGTVVLIR